MADGINWNEAFNIHHANLGVIRLVVAWEKAGYRVSVTGYNSYTLQERFADLDVAKAKAITLGMKKLQEALKLLS